MKSYIKLPRATGLSDTFRKEIKQARQDRGWNQRQLGERTGLSQPHISGIEAGGIMPRFDTMLEIVRTVGLDLMIVPRPLVPAVQALIRDWKNPDAEARPLYALDEADEDADEDEADYEADENKDAGKPLKSAAGDTREF